MVAISVIVPVFNTSRFLSTCVDSLINQTLKEIEIILVDDGSTDDSPSMCDSYAERYHNVKVIHKINEGQGIARNHGISIATGEYITFVDSDDYLDLCTFDYLYRKAVENDLDIIRYATNRFVQEGVFDRNVCLTDNISIHRDPVEIRNMRKWLFGYLPEEASSRIYYYGSACIQLVRRDIIIKNNIRFLSERKYLSEDYLFTYECYKHAKVIGHTPSTLYHYRKNLVSYSRTTRLDGMTRLAAYANHIGNLLREDGFCMESKMYPLAYFLHNSRSFIKIVLQSRLSMRKKYDWFRENTKNEYFQKIKDNYPWRSLSLLHRVYFYASFRRFFTIVYLMTRFQK